MAEWVLRCVICQAEVELWPSELNELARWRSVDSRSYSCIIGGRVTAFKHRLGVPDLTDRDQLEDWLDDDRT